MRLKEDPTKENTEEVDDHTVTTSTGKVMYTEAVCAACFGHGMASLMELGDTFAEYVSVVSGINGIEALIVPRSIFDVIDLPEEPDNYLDDMLGHLYADEEAERLHIILANLDERGRTAISGTIKAYFESADNGFKPSADQFKESIIRSSTTLPPELRDIINKIIKQKAGK